ncbi:cell wall-active antibiotics response protein LiaF [Sporosarcina limicola]|uniref:Membrane protein n=1 Tax=Sporosarcina limicola TaxID=34101 RepID=A0A927MJZ4_9BACL|nr:cell wall-active antibiotics response protein LiaF [Sporosarcina limicola]MBE1555276.1 putative membrane protein [Sporosarcina limicola]
MKHIDTSKITFWGFAFLLLIFIEATFFHNGNTVFVLLGAGLLYYGSRKRSKWTFVIGLFFIVMALLTLWSLRLLIFTILLYVLVKLWKGVPSGEIMRPLKEFQKETPNGIWKNKLFTIQSSPFTSYEWEDIHVQGFFGDIHIDVTDTVLPKGTSFISVRQGLGKIKIDLPYEIPVRIHYTTLLGDARIFDVHRKKLINETLHMKDSYEGQQVGHAELIITLSTWFGDIEVTRK